MHSSLTTVSKHASYAFLYKLVIILAVFDGIRHNSIFYSFSFLKEVTTFILFIALIYEKRFKIDNPAKYPAYSLLIVFLLLVGTLLTIGNLNLLTEALGRVPPINPIALHFKTIEFFLLLFLFSYYTFMTNDSIEKIISFFLNLYVVYIVLNVISYFYHLPFINEFRPYEGRISSGYPTSDSQSISFAFVLLLFAGDKNRNYVIKFLILALGIVIQATTTGIATLIFILSVFLIFGKTLVGPTGIKRFFISISYILGIVVLFVSVVIAYIDPKTLSRFWIMLSSKTEFIFYIVKLKLLGIETGVGHHLVLGTYQKRGAVVEQVMSIYNDPISLLIGKGTALASIVENQFSFMIRAYGYLGFGFYLIFLLALILHSRRIGKNNFWYMTIVMGILILTNASQITSYLFQIGVSFSLAANYCLIPVNKTKYVKT